MDYRRAQRNLDLINDNNVGRHLKSAEGLLEDMEVQHGCQDDDDDVLISTQVPSLKFSQSSPSSPIDSRPTNSSRVNSPRKTLGLMADVINTIHEEMSEDLEVSKGTIELPTTTEVVEVPQNEVANEKQNDSSKEDSQENSTTEHAQAVTTQPGKVFINTQIQSRLDTINRETELKNKLSQFRYETQDNTDSFPLTMEISNGNIHSKRILSRTTSINESQKKRKRGTQTKKNSEPRLTRTQDLLKKLSGKHKKVRDILKSQKELENKNTTDRTNKRTVKSYDVYNAEEWKSISLQILKNFPRSDTQEVKEVFCYLYGDCDVADMWQSSQRPPKELITEGQPNDSQKNKKTEFLVDSPGMMKLLTLSQVMEDTADQEKSLLIIEENIKQNDEKDVSNENSICITQENKLIETESNQLGKDNPEYEYPSVLSLQSSKTSSDNNSDIIVYDSMDEIKLEFPRFSDTDIEKNILLTKPLLLTPNEGSSKIEDPETDLNESEHVVDLTQASFTVSNELISPMKPDETLNKESTPKKKNKNILNNIQVPATRGPTLMSEIANNSPVPEFKCGSIVNVRLSNNVCNLIQEKDISFELIENNMTSDDTIIYDSESCNKNDESLADTSRPNVIELKYSRKDISIKTAESHIVKPSQNENIIVSQASTVQEMRQTIKNIGLKPVRSKSQMVESLEIMSQTIAVNPSSTIATRQDIFDHITKIIQGQPFLLEQIQTFQPILIDTFINELIEIDPFIEKIDESTIQNWADTNGVSLKRS